MSKVKRKKRYPLEFKKNAVKLSNRPGVSVADTAKELSISYPTLNNWRNLFNSESSSDSTEISESTSAKMQHLKNENKRLQMEVEILKKATGDSNSQCNTFIK